MNRRDACVLGLQLLASGTWAQGSDPAVGRISGRCLDLIDAQTNLGLRPGPHGELPGTAKATSALMSAGLNRVLGFQSKRVIEAPLYERNAQPRTRIRNGHSLRAFNLRLAEAIADSILQSHFPLVLGGDCSNLLGCLLGLRSTGGRGLVHVDGHSDFFHPGNYDVASRLGSAAGMDLALATGRGEKLLTEWPRTSGPLVQDADVIQLGEREREDPEYPFREILTTEIRQLTVQQMLAAGIDASVRAAIDQLHARRLDSVWLHVDIDVLDESVMPAVDSPGTPGLTASQLHQLISKLLATGRIAGADVSIYDPDLDPNRTSAATILRVLSAFG